MATITRNTHDDTKNRKKVIQQYGQPVTDSELNELQDILITEATEGIATCFTGLRNTDAGKQPRYGYARGQEFQPYALNTPKIYVRAGTLYVQGYRLVLPSDLDLTTKGITWSAVGLTDVYGYVFVDLVLTEYGAGDDASIATPNIGETSRRSVLVPTWRIVEGASFAAAFAALDALPGVTNPTIWGGNTARAIICRYKRPASSTNITSAMLVDMRQPVPGESPIQFFLRTVKTDNSDGGMVVWNSDNGVLQIGQQSTLTTSAAAQNGFILKASGSMEHYAANTTGVATPTRYPAGTGDAAQNKPDFTKGWVIGDHSALAYTTIDSQVPSNSLLTKFSAGVSTVTDTSPAPTTYVPDGLVVQRLAVVGLDSLDKDPSSFVVCYRRAKDLIWYNGQVTRGVASTNVFTDLGGSPSPWRAILSSDGSDTVAGDNHLTGVDSLERALNFGMLDPASANHTLGVRNLRYYLRGQVPYVFGRGLRKIGNSGTEATTLKNSVIIESEEGFRAQIQLSNPLSSGRGSNDAVMTIVAGTVKLKNLDLSQDNIDNTYLAGYLLRIEANSVELENCIFDSGIELFADSLKITGCQFTGSGHATNGGYAANTLGQLTAQCLFLTSRTSAHSNWLIENNKFAIFPRGTGNDFRGHAAIILNNGVDGIVNIRDNEFDGQTTQEGATIHIFGDSAAISIKHNRFIRAAGTPKTGQTNGIAAPFNGSYGGCPIDNQGGLIAGQSFVANGYISVTRGRKRNSSLEVVENEFDFGSCGQSTTDRFTMFGALMVVNNYLASSSVASLIVANVKFSSNRIKLMTEDSVGWHGTGTNGQPVLWGIYVTRTLQDDNAGNFALAYENFEIENNIFDLGGSVGADAKMYRSILEKNFNSWPGDGNGYLTDTSAPIAIALKNYVVTASVHTGVTMAGLKIRGNQILQRHYAATARYLGTISFNPNAYPNQWFYGIIVTAGVVNPDYTFYVIFGDTGESPGTTTERSNQVTEMIISGNKIAAPIFDTSTTPTGLVFLTGIHCLGSWLGIVCDNTISLGDATTWSLGIRINGINGESAGPGSTGRNNVYANTILNCHTGIVYSSRSGSNDNILNNYDVGVSVTTVAKP